MSVRFYFKAKYLQPLRKILKLCIKHNTWVKIPPLFSPEIGLKYIYRVSQKTLYSRGISNWGNNFRLNFTIKVSFESSIFQLFHDVKFFLLGLILFCYNQLFERKSKIDFPDFSKIVLSFCLFFVCPTEHNSETLGPIFLKFGLKNLEELREWF